MPVEVMWVAEDCPGVSDEDVAARCSESGSILLTFDKDFGELVFRRGLASGSGVVLFRVTPESPEDAAAIVLAAVTTVRDIEGKFCVIRRDRVRVRPMRTASPDTRRIARAKFGRNRHPTIPSDPHRNPASRRQHQ